MLDLVRVRLGWGHVGSCGGVRAAPGGDRFSGGNRDFPNDPVRGGAPGGAPARGRHWNQRRPGKVPVDHPAPYVKDGRIYWGRGSADMKGGLAATAQAAHADGGLGVRLKGYLLVAHGGAGWAWARTWVAWRPWGNQRRRRGDHGSPGVDTLPVVGLGQAAFDFTTHETRRVQSRVVGRPTRRTLILAAVRLVNLMQARHNELAHVNIRALQSFILQGGDFFNRWTNACRLVGTRRYGPEN